MPNQVNIDIVLSKLWKSGKWQLINSNLIAFCILYFGLTTMMSHSFVTFQPNAYRCRDTNGTVDDTWAIHCNYSSIDTCETGYEYCFEQNTVQSSIVSDFDLVFERKYLGETSFTVFIVGTLVGDIVFGYAADKFGRKPVGTLCVVCVMILGIALSVAPNYATFIVCKFFYGVFRDGGIVAGIVWCLECVPTIYRVYAGIGYQMYWCFHWSVFVCIAYLCRTWRTFQLTISLGGLVPILLLCFVPESLTWLMSNNQKTRFDKIIACYVDKCNSAELSADIFPTMDVSTDTNFETAVTTKYTIKDVFGRKRLRQWTLLLNIIWFVCVLNYYGLSFLTPLNAGDLYVNFAISGLVEIPAYILGMYFAQKFGRRKPMQVHLLLSGILMGFSGFLPKPESALSLAVQMGITALQKYSITLVFAIVVIWTPEIYPTSVRSLGASMSYAMSTAAALLAPYSLHLHKEFAWLPTLIFGILNIVACVTIIFLPETHNKNLPECLEDLETVGEETT